MADLLSTSIAGTLNVSQGATISSNLFVSNTDIIPEIAKYGRALTNVYYDHVRSWYSTKQVFDLNGAVGPGYAIGTSQSIFVKPDGTKLYVLDSTLDNVYQYSMTTAHDVASAVYEGNLKITTADTDASELFFSNTGTILYILGDSSNAIDAYDLPNAWNIIAGTTNANNIATGNTLSLFTATWDGMTFSPDGAFLYLTTNPSTSNDQIHQYNVATPWNVATATLSSTLNVAPYGLVGAVSLAMNKTGTKMYVIDDGTNYDQYIYEFNLSQPFQIVTASYSGRTQFWGTFNESSSTTETAASGLFYDADSNTAYYLGNGADNLRTAKTGFGTFIQNSIVVDGKIHANDGLEVAPGSASVLGGALYVSGTSILYSALTVVGTLTLSGSSVIYTGTNYSWGTSTANTTYDIGTGATIANRIKAIRIGTGGLAQSNTDITIGSTSTGGNTKIEIYANTTNISGNLVVSGIDLLGTRLRTIWVPAQTMVPQTTNGAGTTTTQTTTNTVMVKTYDFATATQEYVQFSIRMPKSWDEGTVTYEAAWTADSGTGGVTWSLQGVALSEGDPLDTAWGSAVNVADTLTTAGDLHISPTSTAVTIAGTPLAGDVTFFRVSRVVADANDTLGVDARLIGITLFVTTDAQDDT